MIVDDEKVSLMMTNHILSSEYQTVCASSGKEALELLKKHQIDMVLSDLRMPYMSGYELQEKLNVQSQSQIPFMFMTADKDEETESKSLATGASDFISKPFRADVLLSRVGKILQTAEQIHGLKKAATTDPMTGLLNKASAQEQISELCKKSQGVLMMIDLDSFKLVNDLYGHDMGDKILIRFSEIIQATVRSSDVVGRMGGDEFIAFCQNVQDEVVIEKKARFINKIILQSAKDFMGEDMNIPLGASLGCVFVPSEGSNFEELYKKADKALYDVKQNGKHGFKFFYGNQNVEFEESSVTNGLSGIKKILQERNIVSGALELPFSQFRLIYQFLYRLSLHNSKNVSVLLFTLEQKDSNEEAQKEFLEVLKASLRQSDVVSVFSKTQIIVLLSDMGEENISLVTDRVFDVWKENAWSASSSLSFENENLR